MLNIKQEDQCYLFLLTIKNNVQKAKTVLADTVIFWLRSYLEEQKKLEETLRQVYKEDGSKFGESERVLKLIT